MAFAFVFPGQGSQSLGMLDGLKDFDIVKDTFTEASDLIGIDLLDVLKDDTPERINKTQITQPLMLASGVATYKLWKWFGGGDPLVMAGHSLGEYSALVCADSIKFCDAVKLVSLRAKLMQEAVKEGVGGMAAVLGLDDAGVIEVCQEVTNKGYGVIEAANFNTDGQVVIAGEKIAIEKSLELFMDKGARKVQMLPMSVPSHCSLMKEASDELSIALAKVEFSTPKCKIFHNYDTNEHATPDQIREALKNQLYNPVLWTGVINKIAQQNIYMLVECGAGKVLSGLSKRINKVLLSYTLHNASEFKLALENVK